MDDQRVTPSRAPQSSIEMRQPIVQQPPISPAVDWTATNGFSPWRRQYKIKQRNSGKVEMFKVPISVRKAIKIQKYRNRLLQQNQIQQCLSVKVNKIFMLKDHNLRDHTSQITAAKKKVMKARQYGSASYNNAHHKKLYDQFTSSKSKDTVEIIIRNKDLSNKMLSPLKRGTILGKMIQVYSKSKRELEVANLLNINSLKPVQKQIGLTKKPSIEENLPDKNDDSQRKFLEFKVKEVQRKYMQNHSLMRQERPKITETDSRRLSERVYKRTQKKQKQKPFQVPFQRYWFRDYLWKMTYVHEMIVQVQAEQKNYKVYVGPGNNKMLIKSLMKRRTWWNFSEKAQDCNFTWTQIKINQGFKNQRSNNRNVCKNRLKMAKSQDNSNQSKLIPEPFLSQWQRYISHYKKTEEKSKESLDFRNKYFKNNTILKVKPTTLKIQNHLENNYVIGNKKALFYTMSQYYQKTEQNVFQHLPLTFHIESGLEDPVYAKFLKAYYQKSKEIKKDEKQVKKNSKKNIWIVKPGEFTNRGTGITVCLTLEQIKTIIKSKEKHPNGKNKTYIVQQYIDKPFLYQKRKFDLRHYMMITSMNGIVRGYWYLEGYIRTTSFEYTLKHGSTGTHLTNDAVQKYLPEYGKYEKGNKLSYDEFQKYLDKQYPGKYNFLEQVYPKMKALATDAVRASFFSIDVEKREHNFQIFGMDFMIDENFHPWLIEINTNPCLQISCPLLGKIIPYMVQNALRIGLDPLFPPPLNHVDRKNYFNENLFDTNKFELIFDQLQHGAQILQLYGLGDNKFQVESISEDDEVFQDDGKEWDDV